MMVVRALDGVCEKCSLALPVQESITMVIYRDKTEWSGHKHTKEITEIDTDGVSVTVSSTISVVGSGGSCVREVKIGTYEGMSEAVPEGWTKGEVQGDEG